MSGDTSQGGYLDLNIQRSLIFTQLICPPLPLLCMGAAEREERVTNSHDLMFSMFGRLLSLPEYGRTALKDCFPEAGFRGDWMMHILQGKHAIRLLGFLVASLVNDTDPYTHFCDYGREIIRLLVGYDMASQVAAGAPAAKMAQASYEGSGDVRFLADVGRVNVCKHTSLVRQAIDYHMSVIIFRELHMTEAELEGVRVDLLARRDYKYTIQQSMQLLMRKAQDILDVEMSV